jgi:hypothetical protein
MLFRFCLGVEHKIGKPFTSITRLKNYRSSYLIWRDVQYTDHHLPLTERIDCTVVDENKKPISFTPPLHHLNWI